MLDSLVEIIMNQSIHGLLLFAFIFLFLFVRQKSITARSIHFLWMSFFVLLALPIKSLIDWMAPKVSQVQIFKTVASASPLSKAAEAISMDRASFFPTIWLIGFIIALTFLLFIPWLQQRRMVARLLSSGSEEVAWTLKLQQELGLSSKTKVFSSNEIETPFVVGLFSTKIFLPKKYSEEFSERQIETMLFHEAGHILHNDLLNIIFARLVCCIFWFFPLCYIAYYKLREAQEYLADEVSLLQVSEQNFKQYGETLVKVASESSWNLDYGLQINILGDSNLTRRLKMIKRFKVGRAKVFLPLIAVVVFSIFSYAATTAQSKKSADDYVTVEIDVFKDGELVATPKMISSFGEKAVMMMMSGKELIYMEMVVNKKASGTLRLSGVSCISQNFKIAEVGKTPIKKDYCKEKQTTYHIDTHFGVDADIFDEDGELRYSIKATPGAHTELFQNSSFLDPPGSNH